MVSYHKIIKNIYILYIKFWNCKSFITAKSEFLKANNEEKLVFSCDK